MNAQQNRLYRDVEMLTSVQPPRNYKNLTSLKKVATYIYDELAKAGCQVSYQSFTASGKEYQNVIGLVKGKSDTRIIVGAHYDVCGNQPGADDNASAVAGLLETARLLQSYRETNALPYTVEFVGYCLEEPPFFGTEEMGSAVHAKSIYDQQISIKFMLCYEMIGYFSDEPDSQDFPDESLKAFFPNQGNFIICAGQGKDSKTVVAFAKAMNKYGKVTAYPVATPFTDELIALSDHHNYWPYDYTAFMINDTSFMRNPHYHEVSDTIDTLDFEKMTDVVTSTFKAMVDFMEE